MEVASFTTQLLMQDASSYKFLSEERKRDKAFVINAVKANPWVLQYTSDVMKSDREVVFNAVEANGCVLTFADVTLCSDKDVVLAAVKSNGSSICYADSSLQDDVEVAKTAVMSDTWSYLSLSHNMKGNVEVAKIVIKEALLFRFMPCNIRNSFEIAERAIFWSRRMLLHIEDAQLRHAMRRAGPTELLLLLKHAPWPFCLSSDILTECLLKFYFVE